ncbi:NADPH-dependent glutamate synthase [Ilyobacter polytropus]|uniref:Sulfide dehydrogenase (Flavoprotein) subunit SudA n=1 Tax=Ilyobacter polytropus (strain ATCC 51220 / DSM 2926 / LMG 16218 / CuHBu1) TaxID=572544 RepID=E3HCL2_ILYPC|nr:NADPH-dependent glutamate synthase [Ilyobacter polytropus]ADO83988.1 sulfide dehydrogenase (flavoprotein) subunit SudA [Ilyobacter polytropus DSM 2926]
MGKFNMTLQKTKIAEQNPAERRKNFKEVSLGYSEEEAINEAKRCIQCKSPACVSGCPVNVHIPQFINKVAEGNFEEAYDILVEQNSLPAICGRVCPQEKQCESKCVRGMKGEPVGIGRLERFVADWFIENGKTKEKKAENNNIKVAVTGAGPAGLACAGELAKYGYDVTIFEALHTAGGVLMYGIPEFRLPKEIVKKEIENVAEQGVKIQKNVIVGRSITVDELMEEGYKSVFIGSGAGLPNFMGIEGENLNGVYSANEFLTRVNLMKAYDKNSPTPVSVGEKIAVIGGGNVAMDAARTAVRLGAKEVYVVYRRGEEELPARLEEVHHAKEEGVIFRLLSNPVGIKGDNGWVEKLECVEMELSEPDESGRRRPVAIEGSEFMLDVDRVIIAIGQSPNPLIRQTTKGLETHNWGGIIVEVESMETTKESVYAGGDVVTGAATVILAMGAGKKAAKSIHEKLRKSI